MIKLQINLLRAGTGQFIEIPIPKINSATQTVKITYFYGSLAGTADVSTGGQNQLRYGEVSIDLVGAHLNESVIGRLSDISDLDEVNLDFGANQYRVEVADQNPHRVVNGSLW